MLRFLLICLLALPAAGQIRTLIIDGQSNHQAWPEQTPLLKEYLDEMGLFEVQVLTTPPAGGDMSQFNPDFSKYDLVVSNYNGEPWSAETNEAFEKFVRSGGGFVSVHAADNAFPEWEAYNRMIGIGGWGGRTEEHGPYLRLKDGEWVHDPSPGKGGHHGQRVPYAVDIREPSHPITSEMPERWMHAADELYDSLRGPAENVTVLASGYSDPAVGGTGREEPLIMTIPYGEGRVFHTALGHSVESISCVGFITTFQRGAEWAATGEVTQYMPSEFPTATEVLTR